MTEFTYSTDTSKCFHCIYLLTVVRSNPECGENKTKIYCGIKGCPLAVNPEIKLKNTQKEIAKQKIDKCVEMLKKCIENKSSANKSEGVNEDE